MRLRLGWFLQFDFFVMDIFTLQLECSLTRCHVMSCLSCLSCLSWLALYRDAGLAYRTDCTGFVSMAWGLAQIGTCSWVRGRMNKDDPLFGQIECINMLPGDAMVSSGHIVLFARWTDKVLYVMHKCVCACVCVSVSVAQSAGLFLFGCCDGASSLEGQ